MDGFEAALLFGLIILVIAVMYLAQRIQRLHSHTRYLRHLVQKLEGKDEGAGEPKEEEGGG